MEIIRIPGYTEEEKIEIAKRHLIPKVSEANGLKKGEWSISEEALRDLVRYYTREAGVRDLERELGNLARKAVKEIVAGKAKKVAITARNLEKYAGVRKFRYGEAEAEDMVGVVTGLAWTEVGGDILSIESVSRPWQGQGADHRQAGRRDAGERIGRDLLCAQPRRPVRHQRHRVREARHPRARAGGWRHRRTGLPPVSPWPPPSSRR